MIILGASGHGKVLAEIYLRQGKGDELYYSDDRDISLFSGKEVKSPALIKVTDELIIGIGDNHNRRSVVRRFPDHKFINLIHPSANVSDQVVLGSGIAIMAGVSINVDSIIGDHVILNTNCSVDHDCRLSDFVHVSPNAALAGNVTVGEGVHLGIGSTVLQGVTIGKWAVIGAGAVVLKDIPDNAVVVGNPARIIKYNELF